MNLVSRKGTSLTVHSKRRSQAGIKPSLEHTNGYILFRSLGRIFSFFMIRTRSPFDNDITCRSASRNLCISGPWMTGLGRIASPSFGCNQIWSEAEGAPAIIKAKHCSQKSPEVSVPQVGFEHFILSSSVLVPRPENGQVIESLGADPEPESKEWYTDLSPAKNAGDFFWSPLQ